MRALTALTALLLLGTALALQACGGGGSGSFDIRDDPRLEQYDDELTAEGQTHYPPTVNVSYETVPPYGGPHDSIPLPCGIYTSEPRFENAVHAMEHGAVVIWYSPRLLDRDGLAALDAIGRSAAWRIPSTPSWRPSAHWPLRSHWPVGVSGSTSMKSIPRWSPPSSTSSSTTPRSQRPQEVA